MPRVCNNSEASAHAQLKAEAIEEQPQHGRAHLEDRAHYSAIRDYQCTLYSNLEDHTLCSMFFFATTKINVNYINDSSDWHSHSSQGLKTVVE